MDILTQNEIDELMHALARGEEAETPCGEERPPAAARPYDFRMANKFSKEQMRTLAFIYESYAGRLSTFLSGLLRTAIEVKAAGVEEMTFSALSSRYGVQAVLSLISMPPLHGTILMEMSPEIAYEIIGRVFGGSGEASRKGTKPFTEIDIVIIGRIVRQILSIMAASWERVAAVRPELDRIETNPQFAQVVTGNEPVAVVSMDVRIGAAGGQIKVCIPHGAIQPVAKRMVMETWYAGYTAEAPREEVDHAQVNERLASTQLTVRAVFNETTASVSDVLCIQPGDVIRIDHDVGVGVTVMVEHIPKFKGRIGAHGARYAVKVTEMLQGGSSHE